MKKSELKEMIKSAFIAEIDLFNPQNTDDIQLDAARAQGSLEEEDLDEMLARLSEAEEDLEADLEADIDTPEDDEEIDVEVDAEEEAPAKTTLS